MRVDKLSGEQRRAARAMTKQLARRAGFDDATMLEHDDAVGVADGRQTMAADNDRAPATKARDRRPNEF